MAILEFFGQHWFLAFCSTAVALGMCELTYKVVNRLFRTINVCARGWPPEHLDADGGWKPEPETDGES